MVIRFQDFYGTVPGSSQSEPPAATVSAPVQTTQQAGTSYQPMVGPHLPWLGMLLLLVALRIIYEVAERMD